MISPSRLDEAVARGIITAAQREAILSLGDESAAPAAATAEAPRGFNGVNVAYAVGAVAVLFAFGWFLFERWSTLGALGVLLVSLGYAALFATAAHVLARLGFRTASAVATLLAVGMTPVVTWAVLALSGVWYEPASFPRVPPQVHPAESTRWLPIELATILVASIAIWRVRVGLLALPIAIASAFGALHLIPVIFDPAIAFRIQPWMSLFIGCTLLLAGYAADRRRDEADYAQWLYAVALLAIALGLAELWGTYRRGVPHLIAVLSIGAVIVSLYLRRRMFLVFGAAGAIAYLAYLAFDVFRRTLGFSIVLAGFGLTVIALTVWLQRRYPAIARRMAAQRGDARPRLPGDYTVFGVATALTFILLLTSPPRARRVQREVEERTQRLLDEQRRRDSGIAPRRDSLPR